MIRIGQGFDIHRLVSNKPLIIGGVNIKYDKGLDGHSDADVLIHAIIDALIGAMALGDIGKFYFIKNIKGYHFTCDDDIIYPPNYVDFMLSKLKLHNGFVSCHGAIFNMPFKSFYKSKTVFHFRKKIESDISVDLVGTGVMAYDASKIKVPLTLFENKNMADIYIAIFAKRKNIKCTVVKHNEFFLKDYYIENLSKNYFIRLFQKFKNKLMLENIYKQFKNNHKIQTDLVKENKLWSLYNSTKLD